MAFDIYLIIAGAVSALLLTAGLIAGLAARDDQSAWRIWPAPPAGSLKSFTFWTLFRTLNVVVLVLAGERVLMLTTADAWAPFRLVLAAIAVIAFAAYLYALWALGREATYCRASGLATGGVYRWTRNPQYATAIAAFSALGLAAWSPEATPLAAALVLVYALMAVAEEPWLEARYGRAYADYRADVPRFFNFRHAVSELAALAARKSQPLT
ncbi:CzcN domain-containing protein [Hyphomicrobium denitrificans 1NES1]|uniref:CzcN domain-containing protein n=1 Tax=Hyphomicrobium denitrificans 1NES1 TaxID=670307 RepID=N0B5T5_9HYPH|nr:methyltransferase [Hyphomicrobium denitrificans]AGK58919.1 CzcN domain-containing protein [Hyphomicrobium denitrificans 1NES1]